MIAHQLRNKYACIALIRFKKFKIVMYNNSYRIDVSHESHCHGTEAPKAAEWGGGWDLLSWRKMDSLIFILTYWGIIAQDVNPSHFPRKRSISKLSKHNYCTIHVIDNFIQCHVHVVAGSLTRPRNFVDLLFLIR